MVQHFQSGWPSSFNFLFLRCAGVYHHDYCYPQHCDYEYFNSDNNAYSYLDIDSD